MKPASFCYMTIDIFYLKQKPTRITHPLVVVCMCERLSRFAPGSKSDANMDNVENISCVRMPRFLNWNDTRRKESQHQIIQTPKMRLNFYSFDSNGVPHKKQLHFELPQFNRNQFLFSLRCPYQFLVLFFFFMLFHSFSCSLFSCPTYLTTISNYSNISSVFLS